MNRPHVRQHRARTRQQHHDSKKQLALPPAVYQSYCYSWHYAATHMLPFRFQILDGIPVSDQLVKAVQRAVLAGEMATGEKFPSVRILAQELKISPTTAHKAVMELRDGGFLATRPGAGMVVVRPEGVTRDHLLDQLSPACRDLIRQASLLGLTPEETLDALRRTLSEKP